MMYVLSLLDRLPMPIAVITESGGTEYRNKAFDETFGNDAAQGLKEAARAVAGERGWLHGFFIDGDDARTIDVEIEGRVYRIDKIMRVDEKDVPAVALQFEDVTREREAEQAKSDFACSASRCVVTSSNDSPTPGPSSPSVIMMRSMR